MNEERKRFEDAIASEFALVEDDGRLEPAHPEPTKEFPGGRSHPKGPLRLARLDLRGWKPGNADLTGMDFTESLLENADLSEAKVQEEQFAGADLRGATFKEGFGFEHLAVVNRLISKADWLTTIILLTCVSVIAICASTPQRDLFAERTTLSIPGLSVNVSVRLFFVAIPFVLLGLHLSICFLMKALYESLTELPARFPGGRTVDQQVEGSFPNLCFLAPRHLRHLHRRHGRNAGRPRTERRRPTPPWETAVIGFLIWLVVPFTLLWVLGTYLPRHDGWLTVTHWSVLVIACALSVWSYRSCVAALLYQDVSFHTFVASAPPRWSWRPEFAIALFVLLIAGGADSAVRHSHGPVSPVDEVDRYALGAARLVAFRAAADLEGARLDSVILPRLNLRRANLLGAHLRDADLEYGMLEGASMIGATLTGANLKDADLDNAVLWEARLDSARLVETDLEGADLGSADLTWSRLQGADFTGANLSGARLAGAIVCGARFDGANVTPEQLASTRGFHLLGDTSDANRTAIQQLFENRETRTSETGASDAMKPQDRLAEPSAAGEDTLGPSFLKAGIGRHEAPNGNGDWLMRQYRDWRAAWQDMQRLPPENTRANALGAIDANLDATVLTMGESTQRKKLRLQSRIARLENRPITPFTEIESTRILAAYDSLYRDVRDKARNHCVDVSR